MEKSVAGMLGEIPNRLVRKCAGIGIRPTKIVARAGRLAAILQAVAEPLGIQVQPNATLPNLDPAKKGLFEFLMRGPR